MNQTLYSRQTSGPKRKIALRRLRIGVAATVALPCFVATQVPAHASASVAIEQGAFTAIVQYSATRDAVGPELSCIPGAVPLGVTGSAAGVHSSPDSYPEVGLDWENYGYPVIGDPSLPYPSVDNDPEPGAQTNSISASGSGGWCPAPVGPEGWLNMFGSIDVDFGGPNQAVANGMYCTISDGLSIEGTAFVGDSLRPSGDACSSVLLSAWASYPAEISWAGTFAPIVQDTAGDFNQAVLTGTMTVILNCPADPCPPNVPSLHPGP